MAGKFHELRNDYGNREFHSGELPDEPLTLFTEWMEEAVSSGSYEPSAMTLSTSGTDGYPDSRVVLLKDISDGELIFYTSYASKKGRQIAVNERVALLFFWNALHRQVRIKGKIRKSDQEESESYFRSRPYESKVAAMVSNQSCEIPSREFLENLYIETLEKYRDKEVPMPDEWGGYHVIPEEWEFWQGRSGRLHDRIVYNLESGSWNIKRLAP